MKLTRSEIETISIHMNAFKEKLCNQGRWNEAQEYQDIVDKLDELLTSESVIPCKDCKIKPRCVMYRYNKDPYGFCKWAERKENGNKLLCSEEQTDNR